MPRSKSTVPFNEQTTEDFESCYLIADVDEDSYEYVRENHAAFTSEKPHVGVTPYTRSRRAPALDLIRSTKMPVNKCEDQRSQLFSVNGQRPVRRFLSNSELTNFKEMAQF